MPLLWRARWAPLLWIPPAWAGEAPQTASRSFGFTFLYWLGAVLVMMVVARHLFREQLHERRTLKMMMHRLGPFFPEFDIAVVVRWVERTAPHVWHGWRIRSFDSLGDFGTPALHAEGARLFAEDARLGRERECRLERVLKVHPLGLYMVGEGPPPLDVELMLRVEQRAVEMVRGPDGAVLEGRPGPRQVQHLWTLRHDGRRWRLHRVEPARADVTDLAQRPPLPPLMEWRRPSDPESEA